MRVVSRRVIYKTIAGSIQRHQIIDAVYIFQGKKRIYPLRTRHSVYQPRSADPAFQSVTIQGVRPIHVVLKIILRVNATENDGIFRAYGKLIQPRVLPFFLRPVEMYLPSRFAVGRFILIVIKRFFPFCEAEIGDAHP